MALPAFRISCFGFRASWRSLFPTRSPVGRRVMLKRLSLLAAVGVVFALVVYASADKPAEPPKQLPIPEMKFNDVKEIAPGVFFRYSSISADDPKIKFGGSNHTW